MNINPNNIELIISAVQEAQYPETNLSEVALRVVQMLVNQHLSIV